MRTVCAWLVLAGLTLLPASAQITVEVTQEQDQFLPGESMPTAVRITNRSGQDVPLGAEPDWLTFSIQGREAQVISKRGEVPVQGEFVLQSSKVATKHVDLAPYFALTHSGRYSVTAIVRIKQWNRVITSEPKHFDVIEGAKLWEQDVGVPNTGQSPGAVPEVRKFIVQQANYLKTQLRLYVRLTDTTGARTFRVLPIGPVVSFGRPETQVDRFSNLHLLYQDGAHTFGYAVVSPRGEMIARRTYDCFDRRPRLEPDQTGRIRVKGGTRLSAPTDIPPSPPEPPPEALPQPPVPTNQAAPPRS